MAPLFSQLGGPNALTAAEPFLYPRLADFSFAKVGVCFPEKFSFNTRAAKFGDFAFQVMNKMGTKPLATREADKIVCDRKADEVLATAKRSTAHKARGKVAAHGAAVG